MTRFDDLDLQSGQYWQAKDARIWSAHAAMDEEPVLAWVLPTEINFLIVESLRLLGDIGGLSVCAVNETEQDIRDHALARIRSFVESGIMTERNVNILSRMILGEDMFSHDDADSLRLADLNFDIEDDDCLLTD